MNPDMKIFTVCEKILDPPPPPPQAEHFNFCGAGQNVHHPLTNKKPHKSSTVKSCLI